MLCAEKRPAAHEYGVSPVQWWILKDYVIIDKLGMKQRKHKLEACDNEASKRFKPIEYPQIFSSALDISTDYDQDMS